MATAQQHDVLEEEPSDIAERASEVGEQRLRRPVLEMLVTSVIGGGEVSIGGLAAMTVVGSALKAIPGLELYAALALGGLVFPIGFLFVIVGRSELFTENFLIPVVAVFYKREHKFGTLLTLWLVSWLGNLIGCAGTALLLLVPDAIGEPTRLGYTAYSAYKLGVPLIGVFVSSILAGAVMTTLTWVLLSLKGSVARMLAIGAAGYVLFAANLSHSIVSASILFAGFASAGHSIGDVGIWMVVATCGNLVGGLGLVTMFRLTQAEQQR